MSEEVSVNIIKRGETCIQISLHRTPMGVTLNSKCHKGVEEFMRGLGTGRKVDVDTVGRYWRAVPAEATLQAYDLTQSIGREDEGSKFRLDHLGHPLIEDNGSVNLSFLRLVGISDGAGISFGIKGVYSLSHLRNIQNQLGRCAREFYVSYMQPCDLTVSVSTGETAF